MPDVNLTSSVNRVRYSAVVAGGHSVRMGQDKALMIMPNGSTFLEHIVLVISAINCQKLVIGCKKPGNWKLSNTVFLPDDTPGEGPAAALRTALRYAQSPVLLVACDMPGLTVEAVEWLWLAAEATEATDGVAATNAEGWEPLFAVYFPACLPQLEALLNEGRRSLQALLRSGDFAALTPPENLLPALRNVNTPEEWEAFLRTLA